MFVLCVVDVAHTQLSILQETCGRSRSAAYVAACSVANSPWPIARIGLLSGANCPETGQPAGRGTIIPGPDVDVAQPRFYTNNSRL
ncbi:hypothetical protein RR42_m4071 [Cupriavidus basilensis]|uniref:Uncharacterized protein n=1 Tax=Cupriavidus basilensis TaxID=68895 RepID=A0A0C4YHM0_9BURK|nr:hypothetical protein RR42_m4071 [Cupriavidus basilensis]